MHFNADDPAQPNVTAVTGRTVIVTGAFGALGRVVAARLAKLGAKVAWVDAAPGVPDELVEYHACTLPGVDLRVAEAVQKMVNRVQAQFGPLDAVVNVAGGFRWETIGTGEIATWDLLYEMNVKTALTVSKVALPHLLASGRGRIINIGAAAASKATLGMGAYTASKSAVLRLTEALSEEGKDHGLTVNGILPGIIDTPANRNDMPEADVARWVSPLAIAHVVAFLLSDAGAAITGVGIPVTGRL